MKPGSSIVFFWCVFSNNVCLSRYRPGRREELVSTSLGLGFPQVSTTEGEIAQNKWLREGEKRHVTTIF